MIFRNTLILVLVFLLVSIGCFAESLQQSTPIEGVTLYIEGPQNNQLDARKKLIETIFQKQLFLFSFDALSLSVLNTQHEPRGQMRGKELSLSNHIVSDAEFLQVLIHELGHFVDIYVLRATENEADPSDEFYAISWQAPQIKKPGASIRDFISGYGATNQYEDFAESFVWYVLHNEDFADRALRNEALREKYLFFATSVFPEGQFVGTDFSFGKMPRYMWDTTKTPFLLQKYLFFLEELV